MNYLDVLYSEENFTYQSSLLIMKHVYKKTDAEY